MNNALVIGLGMGQQYRIWLSELNYNVKTVDPDPNKNADYSSVDQALAEDNFYNLIYIGTPNWTHEPIARQVADKTKLLLIEKPGVLNSKSWQQLINDHPSTRIMMVKNNQYRPEIEKFKTLSAASERIYVRWNNRNRIPHPGSWFTTKSKSFGGVSRDLIPHMLSYYCALTNYTQGTKIKSYATQNYNLENIPDTDYGIVNPNGIYDVDDFCHIEFQNGNTTWILSANWKTNLDHDDSSISFNTTNSPIRYELGLCPGEAYKHMIQSATENLNNDTFWQEQLAQDIWIHEQIEQL